MCNMHVAIHVRRGHVPNKKKRHCQWLPVARPDVESRSSWFGQASTSKRKEMDSDGSDAGSDDVATICEETLADTAPYSFRITLGKDDELDSLVTICVEILHGDMPVGHLNARVIDRSFRPCWNFYEVCDAESAELEEVGVTFCNGDGTLRYKDLDGLSVTEDSAASTGGFPHIEQVSLDVEHRRKDVGVR